MCGCLTRVRPKLSFRLRVTGREVRMRLQVPDGVTTSGWSDEFESEAELSYGSEHTAASPSREGLGFGLGLGFKTLGLGLG